MSSLDLTRSPFDNVINFLGGLPQGHEKALKHALYNALALFLLVISSAAGWALYIILGPFIRPLLWALMCGSVLHPFQHSISSQFHQWITDLEYSRSPAVLNLIMLPIELTNFVSELIGGLLVKYIKTFLYLLLGLFSMHLVYSYTPHLCICIGWRIGLLIMTTISWCISHCSTTLVASVVVSHLVLLALFWKPELSRQFETGSWPVWMLLSAYIANMIGSFQVPIFLFIQVTLVAGFLLDVRSTLEHEKSEGLRVTFIDVLRRSLSGELEDVKEEEVEEVELSADDIPMNRDENKEVLQNEKVEPSRDVIEVLGSTTEEKESVDKMQPLKVENKRPRNIVAFGAKPRSLSSDQLQGSQISLEGQIIDLLRDRNRSLKSANAAPSELTISNLDESQSSDKYMYGVVWACFGMLVFNHLWLLYFVPIPIFIYFVKHIGQYFGIWQQFNIHFQKLLVCLSEWCKPRQLALCPIPIKSLRKILSEVHSRAINCLKTTVDPAASVVVIIGVIVFAIATTIFVAVQVYAEGMHIIEVGANVVNSTLVSNSEFFSEIVPAEWYNKMDSVLGNAYLQGREGISNMVRHWLVDVDKVKAAHLEKQVLDLWDRIYQSWMMSGTEAHFIGPTVPPKAVWDNFVDGVQRSPELLFNFDGLLDFVKTNTDSLISVLQTVWTISKGNVNLALHSITAIISVVFGGGFAVLNLLIDVVVFFTALFYLLSSSGVLYKPVDMITNFSPTYGNRFAVALESAFTGVFKASFKMAFFYGLWTWLIHNIFRMKIVYLPSVLAALLAAVPFLGTYWACIPAVLDLWLAQGCGMQALLLFLFQFLPTSVVDTAIYKEIDGGGHPYLTGLSIAGGIFCLGAEGAIIGPVVLCGLFVVVNLSTTLMMDTPTESKMHQRLSELSELSKLRMRSGLISASPSWRMETA